MQSSSQIIITNKPTSSCLQAGCPSSHPAAAAPSSKSKHWRENFHIFLQLCKFPGDISQVFSHCETRYFKYFQIYIMSMDKCHSILLLLAPLQVQLSLPQLCYMYIVPVPGPQLISHLTVQTLGLQIHSVLWYCWLKYMNSIQPGKNLASAISKRSLENYGDPAKPGAIAGKIGWLGKSKVVTQSPVIWWPVIKSIIGFSVS